MSGEKAADRRTVKTKNAIRNALAELLKEKSSAGSPSRRSLTRLMSAG